MKKYCIILSILFLSSCKYSFDTGQKPTWAVVDLSLIKKEVLAEAKKQNPYPKEYAHNKSTISSDYRNTKKQIDYLTRNAQVKCAKPEYRHLGHGVAPPPRPYPGQSYSTLKNSKYNGDCLDRIKNDPLIKDLIVKKEHLDAIMKWQRKYDSKINNEANLKASQIVQDYSLKKYDLVIDKKAQIIHNENGAVIDLTDGILKYITSNTINIRISSEEI